jgi:hypothetical protein
MIKSLDTKLAGIHAHPSGSKAFIIADAKDADMAFGVTAPGPRGGAKSKDDERDWKSLEEFRMQIGNIVRQGMVDVMLLSASNLETLAIEEKLFENSPVTKCGRPLFLKIAYNGPKALSELVSYDPQLIVGILGGSAGTTYDAFKLISDAQKYGARVALFGRKINLSEHPLTFLEMLRKIVDHEITAEEAVKAYHGALSRLGIRPRRELAEDMQLTGTMMRYR